jgi:putative endonuclease
VRNFNCRGGEIDLIMNDGEALVFVEVRYRSQNSHGSGAESVSYTKQARLIRAARYYLGRHPRLSQRPCRFDVISVAGKHGNSQLTWIENAFESPPG